MHRAWSLALPVVTVLVVAYSVLVAGAPRKLTGARVYGGPTEGVSRLVWRIESVSRDGESEARTWFGPIAVQARTSTGVIERTVAHAVDGVAEVELALPAPNRGPLSLELRDARGALLASGDVQLTPERWSARAHRRGGWIRGRALGELIVSIAPARGVFVVGESDLLLLRVERAGRPVAGAKLTVQGEVTLLHDARELVTDANGRASVNYTVEDLNPLIHVDAKTDDGATGSIESGVLVAPGGFHVARTESGFRVEISVPREEAFYSLVTERERVAGGVLTLTPDGRGGSIAEAALPNVSEPAWLVISSELDLNSVAAIGWPLAASSEPAQTFDVADALLLDGLPAAFAREQVRRSHVRWLTAGFVALSLALSVMLLVLRVRAAEREIARHLRESLDAESVPVVAPGRLWALLAAVLLVALGFVLLALLAAARAP